MGKLFLDIKLKVRAEQTGGLPQIRFQFSNMEARQKVLCKKRQTSVKGKGANQRGALSGHGPA